VALTVTVVRPPGEAGSGSKLYLSCEGGDGAPGAHYTALLDDVEQSGRRYTWPPPGALVATLTPGSSVRCAIWQENRAGAGDGDGDFAVGPPFDLEADDLALAASGSSGSRTVAPEDLSFRAEFSCPACAAVSPEPPDPAPPDDGPTSAPTDRPMPTVPPAPPGPTPPPGPGPAPPLRYRIASAGGRTDGALWALAQVAAYASPCADVPVHADNADPLPPPLPLDASSGPGRSPPPILDVSQWQKRGDLGAPGDVYGPAPMKGAWWIAPDSAPRAKGHGAPPVGPRVELQLSAPLDYDNGGATGGMAAAERVGRGRRAPAGLGCVVLGTPQDPPGPDAFPERLELWRRDGDDDDASADDDVWAGWTRAAVWEGDALGPSPHGPASTGRRALDVAAGGGQGRAGGGRSAFGALVAFLTKVTLVGGGLYAIIVVASRRLAAAGGGGGGRGGGGAPPPTSTTLETDGRRLRPERRKLPTTSARAAVAAPWVGLPKWLEGGGRKQGR